jgi:uncharacterized protein (DUF885 family)
MDGMSSGGAEKSPFYSVAQRSSDAAFQTQFSRLIVEQIDPALKRYRDFLQNEYLPKAREGIAVTDLPNGAACYQAFLRQSTTLPRSPQEVFDLGRKTAAATEADILRLGKELFGATDFQAIILAVKGAKGDAEHFKSKEELLEFSRGALARARALTAERLIDRMPKQDVVILPRRDFEDTGPFATYEQEPNTAKPATYRIVLKNWEVETRGSAERVLVHEAWPGHHLQIALARELVPDTPFSKLLGNAAYQEGWARHAEALAEDAGIYQTKTALILRRVGTGGGMVVDPGLHALHWTRQQAIDYLVATGRFNAKSADDLVDRIAVLPGQATSYDSGGLEIKALRAEAQSKLGARFDLREFNHAVLDEGVVPLTELRTHIESWISAKQTAQ